MDRHFSIILKGQIISFPGNTPITIGQTPGCDIRLPNTSQYEDVIFAKIAPNRNAQGWHIVKTSHYYPISVNGSLLNRVKYLNDGDVIDIQRHHLRYHVKEGSQTMPSITYVHKISKIMWAIIALISIVIAFLGYNLYDNRKELITDKMKDEITASLFTIKVDSLQLMYCDSVVESYIYAAGPTGTAFLTTDSLIVTARHCLQPWLNKVLPHEYANIPQMADWSIQKALFAETDNQLSGEEKWHLVSFVTLTDENGKSQSMSSDSFYINTDMDDIVELGNYSEPKYWRSISHRYSRRDMMLGDVAVAKSAKAGNIKISDSDDIRRLLTRRGTKLTFAGHPESGVNGSLLDFKQDELRLPVQEMAEKQGHIFLLTHEGGLSPGFSGGPVIVRDGRGFIAVGVISVVDERNDNRSYSVPTSEIEFIIK